MTPEEVLDAVVRAAEAEGIPPILLVALGVAESNLNPTAERWFDRTVDAQAAIELNGLGPLQDIISDIVRRGSADISFGAFQVTWRFSGEFTGWHVMDILAFRTKSFDIHYQAPVAAKRIKPYLELEGWDGNPEGAPDAMLLGAMYRWNWPAGNGEPKSDGHRRNYERGLRAAMGLLATMEDIPIMAFDPEVRPWELRWRALRPELPYWPDSGIAVWWRGKVKAHMADPQNNPDPGYPLNLYFGSAEETYEWDGVEYAGVVFSKAGLVEWKDPWPGMAGADHSGWPN